MFTLLCQFTVNANIQNEIYTNINKNTQVLIPDFFYILKSMWQC